MAQRDLIRFGEFTLDIVGRRLLQGSRDLSLQPQAFATLVHLISNADRTVTKDELLSSLWPDAVVGEAALTRCVGQIRRVLGDDAKAPRFIQTIPRVGFRFVARTEAPRGSGIRVPTEAKLTIAVLPFRPLHSGERDESLELGMAETLITRLSGLDGLVVRSLSTVRPYAEARDPVKTGRELSVGIVVDGSLQRAGDRLRVAVRVLEVPSGNALMAEQFEEAFRDVFRVQDTLCRRIALAISSEIGKDSLLSTRDTENPEAYGHFLRGRLALGRLTPDDAERSIAHFERSLECDPGYAASYASIAEAWITCASGGVKAAHCYAEARRAAEAALALDDRLGGAWAGLGTVAWQSDRDWIQSDRCFERALTLSPRVVDIWCSYSASCSFSRRLDEGIELARRAVDVDPASPMAGAWLAQALYMAGRTGEAMGVAQATLTRSPGFPFALFFMGLSCLLEGRTREAVDWLEQASRARHDFTGTLVYAYIRDGREDQAARIESLLSTLIERGAAPTFALAPAHAARGDAERVFEAFETTFAQGSWHALLLASEPMFESFRADPRAKELIARLSLPTVAVR